MSECPSLSSCAFFKTFKDDPSLELSLKGFVRMYCRGDKQNDCMRKRVKEALGIAKVPVNMMPNGLPLKKTSRDAWDPQIPAILGSGLGN